MGRLHHGKTLVLVPVLAGVVVWGFARFGTHEASRTNPTGAHSSAARRIPAVFVENRGVVDPAAKFFVRGDPVSFALTDQGVTYLLSSRDGDPRAGVRRAANEMPAPARRWVMRLEFVDGNPHPAISGEEPLAGTVSDFSGSPGRWRTGLATYGSVVYAQVWPGVDVVFSGSAGALKYTLRVAPGADPRSIRFRYSGVTSAALASDGALELTNPVQPLREARPVSFQDHGGRRVPVATDFVLSKTPADGGVEYGFDVGAFDPTARLEIDPVVYAYSGYIGGSSMDQAYGIAVDSAGSAYVVGVTQSLPATLPVAVGPDLTPGGSDDGFIAKVTPDGTGLVYCGYIGGTGFERVNAVAVDSQGRAYLAGETTSSESTFPVVVGPRLVSEGGWEGFVARVNADGTALEYCGYVGKASGARGIAADAAGSAYVVGFVLDSTSNFPAVVGPDLTMNGMQDAFVGKLDPSGAAWVYCGFIGGSHAAEANAVAVDAQGRAYVVGSTDNREDSFPVTVGPDLTQNDPDGTQWGDAYVAKVKADGSGLDYCGYIGGAAIEWAYGVAVDPAGAAYVCGGTYSAEDTFPVKVGPSLVHGGMIDGFVAKVMPDGSALEYCGYLAGTGEDSAEGIAVDGLGRAHVVGSTSSSDFPVVGGPDLQFGGFLDAFAARVSASGDALENCTYHGGSSGQHGWAIAVDAAGNEYIAGDAGAGVPTSVGPDRTFNGGSLDAFVAKLSIDGQTTPTPVPTPSTTPVPSPVVSAVVPGSGPSPNATFVVEGGPFFGTPQIVIGGHPAAGELLLDATHVQAVAPLLLGGSVNDVQATNPDGQSGILPQAWVADYTDVPGSSPFYGDIIAITRASITDGCGPGVYCPGAWVTRRQMAVFILKTVHGGGYLPPECTTATFADVPCSDFYAPWINELAAEDITAGCGNGNYCPGDFVTRAQMSVFLLRGEHGGAYQAPPCDGTAFSDVPCPGHPFADWVNQLAAEGVTAGCGAGAYCPAAPVRRDQMATFLTRTFFH